MATGIPSPHQWLLMGIQRRQYSYPKARSIASSGRSSVPFARHSQPTGMPRPHQWLLMGVQACRLPAPKPLKPSKPLKPFLWASSAGSQQVSQGHINGFLWASKLFLGGPACRSPGIRSQQASQGHINGFLWASKLFLGGPACRSPGIRSQPAAQGHINGFLWASNLAVCQPLNP